MKLRKITVTNDMVIFRVHAAPGGRYSASPVDDNSTFAYGETPTLAIRNLCDDLADEDARAEQEARP